MTSRALLNERRWREWARRDPDPASTDRAWRVTFRCMSRTTGQPPPTAHWQEHFRLPPEAKERPIPPAPCVAYRTKEGA
jgi:hypothetical protein